IDYGSEVKTVAERNRRVTFNDARKQSSPRFQTEAQGQYIEQHNVLNIARQHAALNRRSHCHDFIRIDFGRRFLAEYLFYCSFDNRRTGLSADEDNLIDLRGLQLGIA